MVYTKVGQIYAKKIHKTRWDEQIIYYCVELPHIICIIFTESLLDAFILVKIDQKIKVPAIEFGKLLWFIGI